MVQRRSEEPSKGFWARASLAGRIVAPPAPAPVPKVFSKANDIVTSDVVTVGRLLDGTTRFRLTCFQRAYAWRTEQVSRLLSDIIHAMQQRGRKRRYWLGRLMLAQKPGSYDAELVDGHQRLLTLTMLFAVLRDLETDPVRSEALHRLICDESWPADDPRRYLMIIQSLPAPMFDRIVQRRGATDNEIDTPVDQLSDSERNILANRDCLRAELLAPGTTDQFRRELAEFLLQNCFVVTITVDSQEEAWDMLSIEQSTQLRFTNADEAKSILLSAMRPEDHVPAARLWESCESLLSPDDMYRLLCHIRAINWRGRIQSSRPVETEIVERLSLSTEGMRFLADQLVPYASMLRDIRHRNIGRVGVERETVARHLDYLTWVDPHTWVPALLQWLRINKSDHIDTAEFVRRLDRLVWLSKIGGVDPGVQETRMLDLIAEIAAGKGLSGLTKLDVDSKLRTEALKNLVSSSFAGKHWSGYLLRRLSILLGADPGAILRDEVTVEHVLPRHPPAHSEWFRVFRNDEVCRANYQKLGNIVLLSGMENQKASTRAWTEKCEIFAQSAFALARSCSRESEWTVETIDRRTNELINMLFASWAIDPAAK